MHDDPARSEIIFVMLSEAIPCTLVLGTRNFASRQGKQARHARPKDFAAHVVR